MSKDISEVFRPELQEIEKLLKENSVCIVHFSGCPKGDGIHDYLYPDDLLNILSGNGQGGLATSVVGGSDTFDGFERNVFGNVGLILKMKHKSSLLDASVGDCGSRLNERYERVPDQFRDLSIEYLENTIKNKGASHNEWVVANFDIIGVLAVPPFEVNKMEQLPLEGTEQTIETKNIVAIDLSSISETFKDSKIFTFENGGLYSFDPDTGLTSCELWEGLYG